MHNRANANTDKATAARLQRELAKSRSGRRVAFSTLALFALVFALLSFRLMAGLDPSSSGNTVATSSTPSTQSAISTDDEDEYEDEDEEPSGSADQSRSVGSTTSAPAPATRAS